MYSILIFVLHCRNWESQAPSIDIHAMITNLSVFVLPDESLLDKSKFEGVLERVSTYAQTLVLSSSSPI